jgi:hypothetical protein
VLVRGSYQIRNRGRTAARLVFVPALSFLDFADFMSLRGSRENSSSSFPFGEVQASCYIVTVTQMLQRVMKALT